MDKVTGKAVAHPPRGPVLAEVVHDRLAARMSWPHLRQARRASKLICGLETALAALLGTRHRTDFAAQPRHPPRMLWHSLLILLSPLSAMVSRLLGDDGDRQVLVLRQQVLQEQVPPKIAMGPKQSVRLCRGEEMVLPPAGSRPSAGRGLHPHGCPIERLHLRQVQSALHEAHRAACHHFLCDHRLRELERGQVERHLRP